MSTTERPRGGRRPACSAATTACTSWSRIGRVSAPGGGCRPSSRARMACSSLPGCSSTSTGQPRSARAAPSQPSWAALPPKPGINNTQPGGGVDPWEGQSTSCSGVPRWATGRLRTWLRRAGAWPAWPARPDRPLAIAMPSVIASRGPRSGRGRRRRTARAWRWASSCWRHWEAMATRASRLRVIRRTGTACSRSMVVTVCCCSSSWRRVFTRSGPPACNSGVRSGGAWGAGALSPSAAAAGRGGSGPGGLGGPTAVRGCQSACLPAPLITSPMAPSTCSPAQLSISCRPRERSCTRGARSRRNKSWRLPGSMRSSHTP